MSFYRYAQTMKGNRNNRIDSLLNIFRLSDRLYKGNVNQIEMDISYDAVNVKLENYRNHSLSFLEECLKL